MTYNTNHLDQCIATLETSFEFLSKYQENAIEYEVFRNAVVKGFELTLETAGKLLRKALKSFTAQPKTIDDLPFKEVFRTAHKHGLIDAEQAERWLACRDNRNDTAHDYGLAFAQETLRLLPALIADAKSLSQSLTSHFQKSS